MKVHWLALLIVIGAALFAPAVSAKIIEEKDGYVVSTADDEPAIAVMSRAVASTGSITQGETHYYGTYVPAGTVAFSPVLAWGTPSNSLSLSITGPGLALGPYYDSSDGVIDGRIGLRISRPGGLAAGNWVSAVYGHSVTGSQPYTYQAGLG
jgi:hypothetical protein